MPKASSKSCCEACKASVCSAAQCACETAAAPPPKAVAPPVKKAPVMVLTPKGRVSETLLRAGIVRLAPPRAPTTYPARGRHRPRDAARVSWRGGRARRGALHRHGGELLGRLVYDAARGAWRYALEPPATVVIGPGQPPRPSFEALREAHLDDLRWLLMGGACAAVRT
jgi:hypothetical protein